MSGEALKLHYEVNGDNFVSAGEASEGVKTKLKQLGIAADIIRRVTIAMYEAEINMVIHARGGVVDAVVGSDEIEICLSDTGPGIPDVDLAMKEGYSTATESIRNLGFGAGMGFPNMKKYADSLCIDTELGVGTKVTLGFKY